MIRFAVEGIAARILGSMRLALAFILFAVGSPAFAASADPPSDDGQAEAAKATLLPEFPPDLAFEPNYKLEGIEVPARRRVAPLPGINTGQLEPAARQ